MKKNILFLFIFIFTFFPKISSQNFNINTYKSFLEANKNLDSDQLLQNYSAGEFSSNINTDFNSALYFDSISIKLNLTDHEKLLINKHGFMVSERLAKNSFGEAFLDIFQQDLPVFITTDAILHAFHISYDRILTDVELSVLINYLKSLLNQLHSQIPQLENKYSAYSEMTTMLKDVDVYLTVPLKLLNENIEPYYSSNQTKVNYLVSKAETAEGISNDTLFADACVKIDWSQFKPRGHYVNQQYPELAEYFRAMMWLGRIEIYLIPPRAFPNPPCLEQDFNDAKRQTIDCFLISELFDLSNSWELYNNIEEILRYFIGEPDNVTLDHMKFLKSAVCITDANDLLDSLKLIEFQDTLKNQSFAVQLILSQILINDMMSPDSIKPASSFLLFGQRFVIDSYVTGSVVFDKIKFNGESICRLFPSTLDPMFALGNNAAAQLLKSELDQYHYSSNLNALRYLIDSYPPEFWTGTIYNSWLAALRKLNPPDDRSSLPSFMQTAAFWQEKLNTQLASWAQLRHDNLLYAKQSYTGGTLCFYPFTYVEPFPEFYELLKNYAETSMEKFSKLSFDNEYLENLISGYFVQMAPIMDTLKTISEKILNNEQFSEEEVYFLQTIIYDTPMYSGGTPYAGWYPKLFYRDGEFFNKSLKDMDYIVADIHTTPTDCFGGFIGAVTHVGTGPINLGVFIADLPGNKKVAFAGPVLSYYEYVTTNFQRLTDQEWADEYLTKALKPSWVNLYMADNSGNTKGSGLNLITSVENNNTVIPETKLLAKNYPNPFNPSTIISFTIPFDLTNSFVELSVYNIQGGLVKTLVNEIMPSGNYLVKWNGKNERGISVTSGIYLYSLRAGGKYTSGKMVLIK